MKEIKVKVKGFDFEGAIKGFGGDDLILVEFPGGIRDWFPSSRLVVLIDEQEIKDWIAQQMNNLLAIKNPKGILDMSRQVRLVVGEGDDKVEVGIASIDPITNSDTMVQLDITNPKIAEALGGSQIRGVIPRVEETSPNE